PGKRFPQFLTSISNLRKLLAQFVTLCRNRTLFIYEYATNSSRNFSNLTKQMHRVLRLYECSRNAGLLLVSQRFFKKNPAVAAAGLGHALFPAVSPGRHSV